MHPTHRTIKQTAKQCIRILDIAVNRIYKQGDGCYDQMGAAYKSGNKRDVIFALCGDSITSHSLINYGTISSESLKPVVTHIIRRHMVKVVTGQTRMFFVYFLQKLQDAHDAAFDPFNVVEGSRMELFTSLTNGLRDYLNRRAI